MSSSGLQTDEQLRRLAMFLLGHASIDTRLTAVLVDHKVGEIGGAGVLSLDRIGAISDEVSSQMFAHRLDQARNLGLIPDPLANIASEVNRGRNAVVHFKRNRFDLPRYNGQNVTEEKGYGVCMDDIRIFLLQVPVPYIGWTANP